MNTQTLTRLDVSIFDTTLSDRAIAAGLRHHYHFKVVDYGVPPTAPFYHGLYFIEPVAIPPRGLDRIMCLVRYDIPILGYVVIHEPKVTEEKQEEVRDFKIAEPIVPERDTSGEDALKAVGAVLGAVALGMGFMFLLALRIDPMLICVLDDPQKTWLQIEAWYE
jgi:hypothetical protein